MDAKMAEPSIVTDVAGEAPAALPVDQGGTPVEGSRLSKEQLEQMTADIVAALKTVYDPEIPADIYELGLIYMSDEARLALNMF